MFRIFIALTCVALLGLSGACKKGAEKNAKQPEKKSQKVAPAKTKAAAKSTAAKTPAMTNKGNTKKAPVAVAKRPRLTGAVAKVNGVAIDATAFYAEVDKITSRNSRIPADRLARIEHNILQRLIEKELIQQAIKKQKIEVKDGEVEATFKEYKKRFRSEDQFKNYLKHGRVTVASIKDRLKSKRALEKLIESKGNLEITEEKAKQFYDKNQRFYLEKAGVKASHILVKVPKKATPQQEQAAMAKIKLIQKELKKGADFASVAKKMSEGPSKTRGGDLGFFGKGQMVKPFQEAAFKMKVGNVSGPVRTRFGYHIIKVTGKRDERKKPFKEVKEQIKKSLKNKQFFQERRKLIQGLKTSAKVQKFLPEPPPAARRPSNPHGIGGKHPLGIKRPPTVKRPGAATRRLPINVKAGKRAPVKVKRVAPTKPAPKKPAAKKAAPKKK